MPVRNLPLPLSGMDDHDSFSLEPQFCPNLRNVRSLRNRITRAPGGTLLVPPPTPFAGDPGYGGRVGTFTKIGTTGQQVITHNLGADPVAIIFLSAYNTTSGTKQANLQYSVGFTDLTDERSISAFAQNGLGTSNASRRYAVALLTVVGASEATVAECSYVSSTSSTMTINWTTNDGVEALVNYIVLGIPTMSAKLVEWTLGAATGNQSVTGAGFTPQFAWHLYNGRSVAGNSTDGIFGQGCMTTSGQFATSFQIRDNQGTTKSGRLWNTSATIAAGQPTPDYGVNYSAKFQSMNADGFTVNRTNAPGSGVLVASLLLAGMNNVRIGSYEQPDTNTMPARYNVNVGFMPQVVMPITLRMDDPPTGNDVGYGMGAADGTNQWATATADDEDASSTSDHSITNTTLVTTFLAETFGGQPVSAQASLFSMNSNGFTTNWSQVGDGSGGHNRYPTSYVAFRPASGNSADEVGVIRNYADLIVGGSGNPVESIVMLTNKSAFEYSPVTPSTGIWTPTSEVYTGDEVKRFSIANGTDSTYGAVAVWSQGVDNLRYWDGSTFGGLIASGTDHAARTVLSFNNRIVSVRPFVAGVDQKTQIRWSVNGDFADWAGAGSGVLEVVETSNQALTGGFVLGGRCYLTRAREVIELIATGSLSPVFQTEQRVAGVGCIATHSIAAGDVYSFWLGPDEVYQWDGAQLRAVGGRIYNTITALVDYNTLDQIQAVVYEPDSQYFLVVPPYVFVYDYRRDIWDWDDARDFQAIGRLTVQDLFTGDIDHSEFIVIGDSAVQTIRLDQSLTNYLGAPIDSYFETKDYTAEELLQSFGFRVTLWDLNSLRELRFQAPAGYSIDVDCSLDRGVTYVDTQTVTVNQFGVGVAWFQRPFSQIRFRFRNARLDEPYELHGTWATDVEPAGYNLP